MSPRSDSTSTAQHTSVATRLKPLAHESWRAISKTVGTCVRYRVLGLGAEAAFFAILSLHEQRGAHRAVPP